MKIGILSDTHIYKGRSLSGFIWDALSEVEMILHAGDIVTESFLEDLKSIAPVTAVRGNCDWQIDRLPDKKICRLESLRIGLTHGFQGKGKTTVERAYNTFAEDRVDLIVFGHSHIPYSALFHGVRMFNPGSPTEKRGQTYFSCGLLTIEGGKFDLQHLFFQ